VENPVGGLLPDRAQRDREVSRTRDQYRRRRHLSSFDGPGRAIRCALAIAAAVRALGLEVRAGLHTGEVELMGDNIGGKTAVLISHRFSSVRMADRIVVLADGAVEAVGTHEELLAAGGRYAELFELQAAGYR
jgi:ABC-type branched-subunit amino acid transport system ATPase component